MLVGDPPARKGPGAPMTGALLARRPGGGQARRVVASVAASATEAGVRVPLSR